MLVFEILNFIQYNKRGCLKTGRREKMPWYAILGLIVGCGLLIYFLSYLLTKNPHHKDDYFS